MYVEAKVKDLSLCLLQVYARNAGSEYQVFVEDVNDALQRVGSTESKIFWGIGTDSETRKGVTGGHGDPAFNENGRIYCSFVVATGSAL